MGPQQPPVRGDRGLGNSALDVEIAAAGPGRYVAQDMTVPTAGTWRLTVTVRLDEFTATTASTTFAVR